MESTEIHRTIKISYFRPRTNQPILNTIPLYIIASALITEEKKDKYANKSKIQTNKPAFLNIPNTIK